MEKTNILQRLNAAYQAYCAAVHRANRNPLAPVETIVAGYRNELAALYDAQHAAQDLGLNLLFIQAPAPTYGYYIAR